MKLKLIKIIIEKYIRKYLLIEMYINIHNQNESKIFNLFKVEFLSTRLFLSEKLSG